MDYSDSDDKRIGTFRLRTRPKRGPIAFSSDEETTDDEVEEGRVRRNNQTGEGVETRRSKKRRLEEEGERDEGGNDDDGDEGEVEVEGEGRADDDSDESRHDGDRHEGRADYDGDETRDDNDDRDKSSGSEGGDVESDHFAPSESDEEEPQQIGNPLHRSAFDKPEHVKLKNFDIEGTISRVAHKRLKKFQLETHLFKLDFKRISPGTAPEVGDFIIPLRDALAEILHRLQRFYAPEKNEEGRKKSFRFNEVRVVILHPQMATPLSSGFFNLSNNPRKIAGNVFDNLFNFLQSGSSDIKLDSQFQISIQVFGLNHTSELEKRRQRKARKVGGLRKIISKHEYANHQSFFFEVPSFVEAINFKISFNNQCSVVAMLISLHALEGQEDPEHDCSGRKSPLPDCYWDIHSVDQSKRKVAALLLNSEVENFRTQARGFLHEEGPYSAETVSFIFCELYNVQLHVFCVTGGQCRLTFSYPEEFDRTMRQITVLEEKVDCNLTHWHAIINQSTFFNTFGWYCFACKTYFARKNQHRCRIAKSQCYSCKRNYLVPGMPRNEALNEERFCDSKMKETPQKVRQCDSCNLETTSDNCLKYHNKICSSGYYCRKCKRYIATNTQFPTQMDIRLKHNCDEIFCKHCKLQKKKVHGCQMTKPTFQKTWPKLRFIAASIEDESSTSCARCLELQKKEDFFSLCIEHKNTNGPGVSFVRMNGLVVLEEGRRGCFARRAFFFTALNVSLAVKSFESEYFPSEYAAKDEASRSKQRMKNKASADVEIKRDRQKISAESPSFLHCFLRYVLQPSNFHSTFLVHGSLELNTLAMAFADFDIANTTTFRARAEISTITLEFYNIRFLNFRLYFKDSLLKVKRGYKIDIPDEFFPNSLNFKDYFEYEGDIPELDSFLSPFDSEDESLAKINYHKRLSSSLTEAKKPWNFKAALLDFLTNQVETLASLACQFIKHSFDMQKNLIESSACINKPTDKYLPFIHPFGCPIMSMASYGYCLLKGFCIKVDDLHSVHNEYSGYVKDRVSRGEHEWISFLEAARGRKFDAAFSSSDGQKNVYFGKERIKADACYFDETTRTLEIKLFNGCYIHGHFDGTCKYAKERKWDDTTDNHFGENMMKKYKNFQDKLQRLKSWHEKEGLKVEIEQMFECQWNELAKENAEVATFLGSDKFSRVDLDPLRGTYHKRPLHRLAVRTSIRGGNTESFGLLHQKGDNEVIEFVDRNSTYADAATRDLPIGDYQILTENELVEHYWDEGTRKFKLNGKELIGICQARVIPPGDMEVPFLLYRTRNGETCAGLCKTCMDKKSPSRSGCSHLEKARSLESVWTFIELSYARYLGYKVTHMYEAYIYTEARPILKPYFQHLFALRAKVTPPPPGTKDLSGYCEKFNEAMNLSEEMLKLKPNELVDDPAQRKFYKDLLNLSIGKLAQNSSRYQVRLCTTYSELLSTFDDKTSDVHVIEPINERLCRVVLQPIDELIAPNRSGNTVLYSYILAHSRIGMHKTLMEVKNAKQKLLYHDVDSVAFVRKSNQEFPLTLSTSLGMFKRVFGADEILQFITLGPKTYSVVKQCPTTGQISSKVQVRAFTLDTVNLKSRIQPSLLEEMLLKALNKESHEEILQQKRTYKKRITEFEVRLQDHKFANNLTTRRIIVHRDGEFFTLPHGIERSYIKKNKVTRVMILDKSAERDRRDVVHNSSLK